MPQHSADLIRKVKLLRSQLKRPLIKALVSGAFLFGGIVFTLLSFYIYRGRSMGAVKTKVLAGPSGGFNFSADTGKTATSVVEVSGAVSKPGVYVLGSSDRVGDAIDTAGGVLEGADAMYVLENINLARVIVDGENIYIPFQNEGSAEREVLVNINTADESELEKLSGIGSVTAKKIVDYRKKHGPFKRIEELEGVEGIGKATLSKLEPFIFIP